MRAKGTGTIHDGYVRFNVDGSLVREHTLIAEKALGKKLPPGALVHHVDNNGLNNSHENLVICPNDAYHMLIHARQRAYDACGDANKRKCQFCKIWDSVDNLRTNAGAHHHAECRKIDNARRVQLRKGINNERSI